MYSQNTDLTMTLKITSTRVVETSVSTSNSPSQDYTNPDDQPITNTDSPGSQPTTVLLRTTPTRTINQPQTLTHLGHNQQQFFLRTTPTRTINQPQTLTHLGHNQQQSFSGLHKPGRSTIHKRQLQPTTVFLRTTQTRMINQPQTSVSTNNIPSQDYTNPDDQPTTNVSRNQQQSFSGLHKPGRPTNHKH